VAKADEVTINTVAARAGLIAKAKSGVRSSYFFANLLNAAEVFSISPK
jgi:hypothetical protein